MAHSLNDEQLLLIALRIGLLNRWRWVRLPRRWRPSLLSVR